MDKVFGIGVGVGIANDKRRAVSARTSYAFRALGVLNLYTLCTALWFEKYTHWQLF
jgi:hypothetical protein